MWLDEDMEAELDWIEYQDSLCSGCGHPRHEAMDPANADKYEAVPLTCHACAKRDAERREASEAMSGGAWGKSSFDGLLIGVVEKEA